MAGRSLRVETIADYIASDLEEPGYLSEELEFQDNTYDQGRVLNEYRRLEV